MDNAAIQQMDVTSLKAILSELRKEIIPSRFEKAQQPEKNTIQIGLRTLKRLVWLEISWNAEAPRIVTVNPPEKKGEQSTLAKQLHYGLRHMALIEIEQKEFERIISLKFAIRPGESVDKQLIIELMGRHSNILLLDKNNKVITIGKQIREKQSRIRPIGTGDFYIPPPCLKGYKPSISESYSHWKNRLCLIPTSLYKALMETYQGISPSLALQLAGNNFKTAKSILETKVDNITEADWLKLYNQWCLWLNTIEKEDFSILFEGPTHFRAWGNTNNDKKIYLDKNRIGSYYQHKIINKKSNVIIDALKRKITHAKEDEEFALHKQKHLLSKVSEYKQKKEEADQILCQQSPNKEQINKAQKLYGKAKKLRRSKSILNERINYHEKRIETLIESESFLKDIIELEGKEDRGDKLKMILALSDDIDTYFFPTKLKAAKSNQSRKKQTIIPLEGISPNGLIIQIGRNHSQNDFISLKKGRKGDIWFHAQECPGSHVVLKTAGRINEEEDLQAAADLAAFFSRARGNKTTPVVMVPVENLKRIPGSMPGTVNYRDGKIIWGNSSRAMQHIQQ